MRNLPDLTSLGVSDRWVSAKRIIKDLRASTPRNMDSVALYNARLDTNNTNNVIGYLGYLSMGAHLQLDAIATALENGATWRQKLAKSVGYCMFGDRMNYFWHHQFKQIFPEHPQPLRIMGFAAMTESIAYSLMLGWTEEAIYQGYLTYAAINCEFCSTSEYSNEHRRAHVLMLRLFADWRSDGLSRDWPSWAFDVSAYNEILNRWRDPNPGVLAPWLLAACDRHTHEGRYDSSKTSYDFGDYRITRTPIEILFVLRLRELIGLSNPRLNHPLMSAPFDELPEAQPVFRPDELMLATLKRAREDWPHIEQLTSLQALIQRAH